jgi:hypothetical protein
MAVKKMVYLETTQQALLRRLSAEEHASESEIVRRALDLYARDRLKDPLAKLVAAFGGPTDGAENHDGYLVRDGTAE